MAFRAPCDSCHIQNIECDCDDDLKPPKRQWPPELYQPCVCHLVPPFNRKKIVKYNLPKPPENFKSLIEPNYLRKPYAGQMSFKTVYNDSYTPKSGKKLKSFWKQEHIVFSKEPISGETSTGAAYQYRKGEPAKLVRYCKRDILGRKAIDFTSTYRNDFYEKPDSRRKSFTKKFIFIPSTKPVEQRSVMEDSYVPHPTPKVVLNKTKNTYIPSNLHGQIVPTTYQTDYIGLKIETRNQIPWKIYEKSRKKVSEGRMLHASEYTDNFVPLTESPTKPSPPTGDPCHGICECYRPGICLPNDLNLDGRAKLCDCHETIDYCEEYEK